MNNHWTHNHNQNCIKDTFLIINNFLLLFHICFTLILILFCIVSILCVDAYFIYCNYKVLRTFKITAAVISPLLLLFVTYAYVCFFLKVKDRKLKSLPPRQPDPYERLLLDIRSQPKLKPIKGGRIVGKIAPTFLSVSLFLIFSHPP